MWKKSEKSQSQNTAGIVYFSLDKGLTWENRSNGLPNEINLTDLAVEDDLLGVSTKTNGIFLFDFDKNIWKNTPTKPSEKYNADVLLFHGKKIFVGTQNGGIFVSMDRGNKWQNVNDGLKDLTIRRLTKIANKIYAGTNSGLYIFDEKLNIWSLIFDHNRLQVNGVTDFDKTIYIGTNQGVFMLDKVTNGWIHVFKNKPLHNISAVNNKLFALVYNELFVSTDKGKTWQSDQQGMPFDAYSFQLIEQGNSMLIAQWDGVYQKDLYLPSIWQLSSKGMPHKLPITELKVYKNLLVASSSAWSK